MPEQTEELTELLMDTVDADIAWGVPTVNVIPAVRSILARWVLIPIADICPNPSNMPVHAPGSAPRDCQACHTEYLVEQHQHSWIDSMDGSMKCATCGAEHHYTF